MLEPAIFLTFQSKYEPGKRHWLKVKKDYLLSGAMADSADLVVLGAWYGTGQKGQIKLFFICVRYQNAAYVSYVENRLIAALF